MKVLSIRRIVVACILSSAFGVALAAPGVASAEPLGEKCSGETPIKGRGSTFQKLAQGVWTPGFNTVKGKPNLNTFACGGSQGGKKVIKVEYLNTAEEDKGSGACLKAFGAGVPVAKYGKFGFCGTDEAKSSGPQLDNHRNCGRRSDLCRVCSK